MHSLGANRAEIGYELESELGRASVHATERDPNRRLAWVNSVCILFLLIGITGSKPAPLKVRALPRVEEIGASIVEPLPLPQKQSEEQQQESSSDDPVDTPQMVVVTPAAPSISFSVPTIGNLVVPTAMAKPPPLAPLKPVAPLRTEPAILNSTGKNGERPHPPYPKIALDQGQQGSVTLRMSVDAGGTITSIEVLRSSSFPILDRSALDFVKRHWTVPAGTGDRIYEASIDYKLQTN